MTLVQRINGIIPLSSMKTQEQNFRYCKIQRIFGIRQCKNWRHGVHSKGISSLYLLLTILWLIVQPNATSRGLR